MNSNTSISITKEDKELLHSLRKELAEKLNRKNITLLELLQLFTKLNVDELVNLYRR